MQHHQLGTGHLPGMAACQRSRHAGWLPICSTAKRPLTKKVTCSHHADSLCTPLSPASEPAASGPLKLLPHTVCSHWTSQQSTKGSCSCEAAEQGVYLQSWCTLCLPICWPMRSDSNTPTCFRSSTIALAASSMPECAVVFASREAICTAGASSAKLPGGLSALCPPPCPGGCPSAVPTGIH